MDPGIVALGVSIMGVVAGVVAYMTKLLKDVKEIHIMVNSNLAEANANVAAALQRIDQLESLLIEKGIASPGNST